ncbi:discoidin domain-containing protein [Nostoc sp.]|uniref:discoidin domain-containing protein n=1 Tax=Nostoc sp. TaxID=1180 RepID=UPI002FF715A3
MRLNQFPELTSLADDDLLVVWHTETSTVRTIKASTLKEYIGTSNEESPSGKILTISASGDSNGLFYWIGTSSGTDTWTNPTGKGLVIEASSIGSGSVSSLVDRANSDFYTNSDTNAWVSFYLNGKSLKCNHYSIKTRASSSDYYPRNWKLQGSNDANNWVDLDSQVNNTTLTANSQWLSIPVANSNVAYTNFRIYMTGNNSSSYGHLVLGEVELYGTYLE